MAGLAFRVALRHVPRFKEAVIAIFEEPIREHRRVGTNPGIRRPCLAPAVLAISILLQNAGATANPAFLPNDPKRPVAAISRDLGVKPEQFVACFAHVRPARHGEHPTRQRTHANKAVLLPCLQRANPAITNERLDAVMDKYRPGGHAAQEPDGGH